MESGSSRNKIEPHDRGGRENIRRQNVFTAFEKILLWEKPAPHVRRRFSQWKYNNLLGLGGFLIGSLLSRSLGQLREAHQDGSNLSAGSGSLGSDGAVSVALE